MKSKAASIEFQHVSKLFGNVAAVDDVSFRIEAGTLVTLLGPSGCGKTTTLRMIAGLEMASRGRILIGERDVTDIPATDRDVSMVFQSYALFPHMNVSENVKYGLTVSDVAKAEAAQRAAEALETVGLTGFGQRLPSELSGGQQQRVAVARALVLEPSVLLFDEPLSNLDARLRRKMREEIRDLQQRLGLTVVYVTHDQSEAMAVSDRIIVMNRAVIAQEGTPRALYQEPKDTFVGSFMGDANQVVGELTHVDDAYASLRLDGLLMTVAHRGVPAGRVQVAIRPEVIRFSTSGEGLAGTVKKAAYLGALMEYEIDTPVGELFATHPDVTTPFVPGDAVRLEFLPHGVIPLAAA